MNKCTICRIDFECSKGFQKCSKCRLRNSEYIKQVRKNIVVIDGTKKCITCLKIKDEDYFNGFKSCKDCLNKVRIATIKKLSLVVLDETKTLCSSCNIQKSPDEFIISSSFSSSKDYKGLKENIVIKKYKTCITCRNRIKTYRVK